PPLRLGAAAGLGRPGLPRGAAGGAALLRRAPLRALRRGRGLRRPGGRDGRRRPVVVAPPSRKGGAAVHRGGRGGRGRGGFRGTAEVPGRYGCPPARGSPSGTD